MVVKRKRKARKHLGSKSWGWGGGGKRHRGSGNRGGVGNSATGKRAHARKPSVWGTRYFGKHGFTIHGMYFKHQPLNVCDLEDKVDTWVSKGVASKDKDVYAVDLAKLGYTKLLSSGKVIKKFKITVPFASAHVLEKVKKAGGDVIVNKTELPKEQKKE